MNFFLLSEDVLKNVGNQKVDGTPSEEINYYGSQWVSDSSAVWLPTIFEISIFYLCSTEERNSYTFGTT